jgi:hypothetical protein
MFEGLVVVQTIAERLLELLDVDLTSAQRIAGEGEKLLSGASPLPLSGLQAWVRGGRSLAVRWCAAAYTPLSFVASLDLGSSLVLAQLIAQCPQADPKDLGRLSPVTIHRLQGLHDECAFHLPYRHGGLAQRRRR